MLVVRHDYVISGVGISEKKTSARMSSLKYRQGADNQFEWGPRIGLIL